jgi:hypothetical protein
MVTLQLAPILEVPSTLDGWLLHLNQMEPHDAWILDELEVSGLVDDVANSIRTGTSRAVSDGSFKDTAGAAAFCIVLPETGSYLQGSHTVPGPATSQSADCRKTLWYSRYSTPVNSTTKAVQA